jgi:hypothetical protein
MSEKSVGKNVNSPDILVEIEKEKNGPVINSEYFVDVIPLDMAVIHETTPVGGLDPEDTSMEKTAAVEPDKEK